MPKVDYNVSQGAILTTSAINTITSYNPRLSHGYLKFYLKGVKNIVVIRRQGVNVLIVPNSSVSVKDQTALYDKVKSHQDFYDFLDALPEQRFGEDIIFDASTMQEVRPDAFLDYIPSTILGELFVVVTKENGVTYAQWPPYVLSSPPHEVEANETVIIASGLAARKMITPGMKSWTNTGKLLLIMLVAQDYDKKLPTSDYALDDLAKRQPFFVPTVDPQSMRIPEASLKRLTTITQHLAEKIPQNRKLSDKLDEEAERLEEKAKKHDATITAIFAGKSSGAVAMSELLEVGIDQYLKSLPETEVFDVVMDVELEPVAYIKEMKIFAGSLLVDPGTHNTKLEDLKNAFDTDNVVLTVLSE